jgi:peptidoglycan L-alanyl-D-glutamate endopeptidase CwlK
MKFGPSSEKHLEGVHPDLVAVMREAIKESPVDFSIIDGLRTLAEQKKYVAKGASKTMKSRHLTGKAVDIMALVNGKGRWEEALYRQIGPHVKAAAKKLKVAIVWGGDWNWKDWGHFELDVKKYGY